jgi:hypothetical protein
MKNIIRTIKKYLVKFDMISRKKAIDDLEWEIQELRHIFAILTLGSFIGIPASPLPIAFELLPDLETEFAILLSKIGTAHDPLSEQFSKLDAI